MSDTTTNAMAQVSDAVHGMRRGFVLVITDPTPLHACEDSFSEEIQTVRDYAAEWFDGYGWMICPAYLCWKYPVEIHDREPLAAQTTKETTPSMF